jgi:hypothetical protein
VGRFLNKTHICAASIRSCCGHICSQSSRGIALDVGFGVSTDRPEGFREILRTDARTRCIEKLLAIRPWVDFVDLQIFLEGFDAGDEFASRTGSGNDSASPRYS